MAFSHQRGRWVRWWQVGVGAARWLREQQLAKLQSANM